MKVHFRIQKVQCVPGLLATILVLFLLQVEMYHNQSDKKDQYYQLLWIQLIAVKCIISAISSLFLVGINLSLIMIISRL